jgi:hypothetical protein
VCDDTWSRTCAKDNQTKNLFGCDPLNYNIRLSNRLVLLNRKILLRADASSSGHFLFVSGVGVTLKNFHYRIRDP